MKTACLAMIGCAFAWGQDTSANRAIAAAAPTRENLAVKLLRPFEPETGLYRPLTARERFHEYLIPTIGPFTIIREAAAAGMGQAMNSPPEWRGGAEGYFKRFGNDLAENATHNILAYGFSAALREDNRYFGSGKSGTMRRVLHAAMSPFEARHDDGHAGFSYSNTGAVVGASLISRTWAPQSWRGGGNIGEDIAVSFAGQAAFNIFREFVPDLLHRKR